jgi:hypothetical protein
LPQTGQFAGKSPNSQIQVPHDDAAGLRVVAFSGVLRLNWPDDASCGFLAEDRQCRTKTEGAVAVGSNRESPVFISCLGTTAHFLHQRFASTDISTIKKNSENRDI